MEKFSKGPSRPSRSTEYNRRLAELEDFIAKNRLVSKEAQMSSMSGEGYTDPRFFKTTGNPLIDQYGMRPFPAEGSGQILSTTELGMGGKKELFNIGNPGKYRPIADTIVYKDISDLYKNTDLTPVTTETTQKHEFFHRAAQKSGWINNFHNSPYLKKNVKLLSGENGRILKPLINEAVAHSYEYDKDYSKDKELKKEINFRASKFNLKDPKKIADEIFDNIKYLRDDFEKYLEEVTVEYLPENVNSYTTTRTNKSNGGEAYDLPEVQPVQNYATEEDLAKSTYAADAAKEAKNYARQVEIAKYNDPHLYEIYSIEDPETRQRALDEYKDFSVFRDVLPFIPINVKQYAYHMAGGKGDVDINDLTDKELKTYYRIAQEIMASGELPLDQDSTVMVDYPNYGTESDYGDIYWGKKNLGLSDEKLEAWKRGEIYVVYGSGRKGKRDYTYEEFLKEYPGALDSDGQSIGDLYTNMQDKNYIAKTFTGKADLNYNKDSNTITVTDNYNHNRDPKATTKTIIEAFMADPGLYAALKAGAVLKNADGSVIELDLGSPEFVKNYPTGMSNGGEIQSALDEFGIKPIGETSTFKMAMAVLSPEQKLKKIKLLKKYFDKMRQAESLQKPGAALGDLSQATKIKKNIPYSSSKSIQKELDQLQGAEKLDLNLLAKLRKEFNI